MKLFKPSFWDEKQVSVYSIILFPISLILQILISIKKKIIKTKNFPIPIICVGNIYLGGTGKTPLCIELHKILKKLGKKPVFVRKKYKHYIDEKKLLEQFNNVYENYNRADAIHDAVKNEFETVIMDDGFQDFSIKKDFSIVCFNEKQWIGNGLTIPSGPLRESLNALNRADCVMINGKKNVVIEKKILEKNKEIKIFYTKYIIENINNFKKKKTICFAGIGNPENFFDLLRLNGVNIHEKIKFPDHYNFTKKDLDSLIKKSRENSAILLTTEKDYLRIDNEFRKNINFIKIKLEIENEDNLIESIKKLYENN